MPAPRALDAGELVHRGARAVGGRASKRHACDSTSFASSRFALALRLIVVGRALAKGMGSHAHVAACLAEHGRVERAIGVAFDGTGCGSDGDLWGNEFLIANLEDCREAGHLRALPLPGGEAASPAPWRIGVAALLEAGEPLTAFSAIEPAKLDPLRRMLARRVGTRLATGAGRWFDAVAAIAGVRAEISYEGQAAIELEAVAERGSHDPYPFVVDGEPFVVDLLPTIRAVAADARARVPAARIAARFHETMAHVVVAGCLRAHDVERIGVVALSGGCFQNRRLAERAVALLEDEGFEVLVHRRVTPDDGGLALGQAAIATARLAKEG
jgi:hydrogenase maturation protein HypF